MITKDKDVRIPQTPAEILAAKKQHSRTEFNI
jgi:hypothetical protein